jgi:signal transduction histidine kinase/ActR/RegA family two-component response regulator
MEAPTLAQVLTERRDQITARFVIEVRRTDLPPADLSPANLTDHIPAFLDEVLVELQSQRQARTTFDAIDESATARRHGGQRWRLGYDLEALIREYGILRHCILEEATQAGAEVSVGEVDLLAKCLNVGATEAAAAYVRKRDEEWAFLAEAGKVLSSSLDRISILAQLSRLLIPRVADWCMVHVAGTEDTAVGHVDPAKVDVVRKLHQLLSASAGTSGVYHHILQSGEPELVEEARNDHLARFAATAEERALFAQIGGRSWMALPLRVTAETSGVLVLGYDQSEVRYSRADLRVMEETARRAAVALENARLYELSQQARTRVEAATRAKDEFVAMVSHELRTPLNAILGWLRLHRDGMLPPEKRGHVFDVVERNANTLSALVGDLLDVSRIFAGSIRLSFSLVDLARVVELAVEALRPALEAKGLELTLNLGLPRAAIRGDGERLQQVIWNLLSNAIKFTPRQGAITVSVRHIDAVEQEIEVRDTGSGIPAEFLPRVFESFRQWESGSTRRHGGLGIGLSISKHLVELHGGSITAYSEGPGKGSTFVVRLPVAPLPLGQEVEPRVPASRSPYPGLSDSLAGLRVLVIDDDEDARELLRVLLEQSGIEVRSAEGVEAGITQFESFRPDVVISDVAMPGEDGYSLIRRVRVLASDLARTPAIALTAYARNEDRTRALVEGFNAHLSKPVEPAELLRIVADLAGRPQTVNPQR